MIGQTISHYKILAKLGEGGMGVVYKAEDTKLKRIVALKFLSAIALGGEDKSRFLREAQAAAALNHPNICTIHAIDEVDGQMFIAMEFIEGQSLLEKIASGMLQVASVIDIAKQIAEGLQAAHEKGITHRDIKSANIMITEKGQVKIMDFGLAKLVRGGTMLTKEGMTLGTAAYMSPEQARGEVVDQRTDIWSLGVVLYEMISGRLPFRGEYESAMMYSILNEEPEPLSALRTGVPMELERIVNKAMAKIAGERYQHADELLADLKKLKKDLESGRTAISAAPTPITEQKSIWRQPAYLIIAFMAMIILVVSVQWFFKKDEKAPIVSAQENSIAVMYFENLTGDSSLDWIETGMVEMLTANLGHFEALNVLSSQRLFDIMRQISGKEATQIDRNTATRIAQKAGVGTMLLGSVLGTSGQMRLSTQLVEVSTGRLVGSEVLDTGPEGSLFSVVDLLTQRIVDRLEVQSPDWPVQVNVAYTLTNSPEALRHHVEGIQALYRSKFSQAIEQFKAAVTADSTFAMAYYHRAIANSWETGGVDREALVKARKYADKISERERALIEATSLELREDLPKRKEMFEQVVERYPDEKFAWYQLGEIFYHNLQEARDRRPNSAPQAYEEGIFLLLRGKPAAAHDNAQKILDLYDSGAEPFVEVAALGWHLSFRVNLAKGNMERAQQAIAELEKLGMSRENEYAFLYDDALGRLSCYRGEVNAAQRHFTQALTTVSFTGSEVGILILFRRLILDALLECLEKAGDYKTLLRWSEEIFPFVYHYHDFTPALRQCGTGRCCVKRVPTRRSVKPQRRLWLMRSFLKIGKMPTRICRS